MASGLTNQLTTNASNATEVINFDTETRFFVYTNTSGSSGTKPSNVGNGFLITFVREYGVTAMQFFIAYNGNVLFQRAQSSSNWTQWRSITFS